MTYCLGMLLEEGLMLIADTRTNAGVDNFSSYRKLHALASGADVNAGSSSMRPLHGAAAFGQAAPRAGAVISSHHASKLRCPFSCAPVETLSVTSVPGGCSDPGAGSWSMTVPSGCSDSTSCPALSTASFAPSPSPSCAAGRTS